MKQALAVVFLLAVIISPAPFPALAAPDYGAEGVSSTEFASSPTVLVANSRRQTTDRLEADAPAPGKLAKLPRKTTRSLTSPSEPSHSGLPGPLQLTKREKAWLKMHDTVVIGGIATYPPYEFVDEEGQYQGIAADYLRIIGKRVGLKIVAFAGEPWNKMLAKAKARKLDGVACLAYSEKRSKYFIYTKPYTTSALGIFTKEDYPAIGNIDELSGKTVAIEKGFSSHKILAKKYPQIKLLLKTNGVEALKAVAAKAADAYVGNVMVAKHLIRTQGLTDIIFASPTGLPAKPQHIGIRKDWPEFASIVDKAMATISAAERKAIVNKWLGPSQAAKPQPAGKLDLTLEEKKWLESHPVIRVGVNLNYPPFEFVDENGVYRGFGADYLRLVGQILGVEFRVDTSLPWAEAVRFVKEGKLDALPVMTPSPERREFLRFSKPYIGYPMVIVTRDDAPAVDGITSLASLKVTVPKSYFQTEVLAKKLPSKFPILVDTPLEGLEMVASEFADAYLGSLAIISFVISEHSFSNLKIADIIKGVETKYAFGVRKDWPLLASLVQKALDAIPREKYLAIRDKWVPVQVGMRERQELTPGEKKWLSRHKQVRIGVDPTWAPYDYIDQKGNHAGVTSEYLRIIGENLGIRMTPDKGPQRNELKDKIRSRTLDVITSISPPQKGSQHLIFTKPYLKLPLVIIARRETPALEGIGDLSGRKVALVKGDTLKELLLRDFPRLKLLLVPDHRKALEAIARGEVFAILGSIASVRKAEEAAGVTNLRVVGTTPYNYELSFGVRRDWPQLVRILDKEISSFTQLERTIIHDKWANLREAKQVDWGAVWRIAGPIGGVVLIILVVFFYWNRRLTSEVRERKKVQAALRLDEERLEALLTLTRRSFDSEQELMDTFLEEGVRLSKSKIGFLHLLDESGNILSLLSWPKAVHEQRTAEKAPSYPLEQAGVWADCVRERKVTIHNDYTNLPEQKDRPEGLFPVLRHMSVPVFNEDLVVAVMCVGDRERPYLESDARQLSLFLNGMWTTLKQWRAEHEAEQQRVFFKQLLDNSPEAIVLINQDGEVVRINAKFTELFGYTPHAVMGKRISDFFPDLEARDGLPSLGDRLSAGETIHTDVVRSHKDGTPIHVSLLGAPVIIDGDVTHRIITYRDIRRRKKIEKALTDSEEKYRTVIDNAEEGIAVVQDGYFRWGNPQLASIWGHPLEKLTAQPLNGFLHPEDRGTVMKRHQLSLAGGRPTARYDFRVVDSQSQVRWVEVSMVVIAWEDRPALLSFFQEITARKEANEKLRESQRRLDMALKGGDLGSWDSDFQTKTTVVNERWAKIMGLSSGEGEYPLGIWEHSIFPEDSARVRKHGKDYRDGKTDFYDVEYRALTPQGDIRWLSSKGKATAWAEDGKVVRMVGTVMDVTERRQREQELRDSQERLGQIIDFLPDPTWVIDIEGRVVAWNRAMEQLTEVKATDILGKGDHEYALPLYQERCPVLIDLVLQSNADFKERYITLKESDDHLVSESFHPHLGENGLYLAGVASKLHDGQGNVVGAIESVRDITSRVLAEQAVKESEERNRMFLESLPEPTMVYDLEGKVLYVNPAFEATFGWSGEEVIGEKVDFVPPEEEKAGSGEIKNILHDGVASSELETKRFTKSGELLDVLVSSLPLKDLEGSTNGQVVVLSDITTRKKAEEQIRKLYRVVEQSPVAVVITDTQGVIEYINPKFSEVSGYSWEEAIGQTPRLIKSGHTKDEDYSRLWQTITSGGEWRGELLNKRKDGGVFWEESTISPIKDPQGNITHFVAVKLDITDRKKMEGDLGKAKEEAEAANRAKSDFLANMSHEIRTPMNAIIGLTHLCLQTGISPKQEEYLGSIQSSANSLLGIINDILDFSKIEAGKLNLESTEFVLESVLDSIAKILSLPAHEKGLELSFCTGKEANLDLLGDPLRLEQVLLNLASNAVKFTDEGDVVITIREKERIADKVRLIFSIRDTGIGIDEEDAQRLFDPFTQADESTTRQFGGTGLGLAICQKLVELMGGEIWVESTPGQGSTFSFTATFQLGSPETTKTYIAPSDLEGTKVLVVDDNETSRLILGEMLHSFSFEVDFATSAIEGIDMLEKRSSSDPYDLVIMDWKMPGMDGIEASRTIKSHPGLSKTPTIIMVTAYGTDHILSQAKDVGLEGFLVKPISSSAMFNTVMGVFSRDEVKVASRPGKTARSIAVPSDIQGAAILVAEDNRLNQQVIRELLKSAGFLVTMVPNGQEAVEAARKRSFDLVLMDIQMPVLNGYEATREIRRDPSLKDLPILAMTAHAMAGDREKSLEAGMNDHVTKPIEPNKLFGTLKKWITPAKRKSAPYKTKPKSIGSAQPEEFESLRGIDPKVGIFQLGGDWELYRSLLQGFFEDYESLASQMKQDIGQGKFEEVHRTAHSIKSVSGSIGAKGVMRAAEALEKALHRGDKEVGDLVEQFAQSLEPVLTSIKEMPAPEQGDGVDGAPQKTLDAQELGPRLQDLANLLSINDVQSEAVFDEVRPTLDAQLPDETEKMMEKLDLYDFQGALAQLNRMVAKLELNIELGE